MKSEIRAFYNRSIKKTTKTKIVLIPHNKPVFSLQKHSHIFSKSVEEIQLTPALYSTSSNVSWDKASKKY
jgi:hypothetical protein